jgi:hypothetical protein
MGPNSWATIEFKRKKENPPDCYNRFQAVTKISKNSFLIKISLSYLVYSQMWLYLLVHAQIKYKEKQTRAYLLPPIREMNYPCYPKNTKRKNSGLFLGNLRLA